MALNLRLLKFTPISEHRDLAQAALRYPFPKTFFKISSCTFSHKSFEGAGIQHVQQKSRFF